jgi:hypothetical protein
MGGNVLVLSLVFSNKLNFQGGFEMYRFLIIIEKGNENYGAYSPDLPGCVAVGETPEEVEKICMKRLRCTYKE